MLRVVHASSVHPWTDIRILRKECASLAAAGYQVSFVVPAEKDCRASGVDILAVTVPRNRVERLTLTGFLVFVRVLRIRPDICQIHDPELLFWGQCLRLFGVRVVYDMHENLPMSILVKHWIPAKARGLLSSVSAFAEQLLNRGMFTIYAESSYITPARELNAHAVVRNMPRLEILETVSGDKYGVFTITYVGAVSEERGSVDMILAMAELQRRGHAIDFECIGQASPEHLTVLQALVARLKLRGTVTFRGHLPAEVAWGIAVRCHCGLAVLRDLPNYTESYPTKMFEYMALGLAVVASSFPLYQSVVENADCGFCVRPSDPQALADALEPLITNDALRERLARNGRTAANAQFSWRTEEVSLLAAYSVLAAERAS